MHKPRYRGYTMNDIVEGFTAGVNETLRGMSAAARDVLTERRRQIEAEGWSPEHDDEHANGGLALAAACYALSSAGIKGDDPAQLRFWPWGNDWWRPSDRRRDLVKAGALILAEIERLDRAALAAKKPK